MTHPQEGLEAWTEQVHAYRIPRYDELPTLELYMDQVVAASGAGKKELQDRLISRQLEKVLGERNSILACAGDKKYTPIVKDPEETYACQVISPILCEGDVIGGVIFLVRDGKKKLGEVEQKMASCAAAFLGRQMEQ